MVRMGKRASASDQFYFKGSLPLALVASVHTGWCLGGLVGGKRSLWYEVHGEAVDGALGITPTVSAGEVLTTDQSLAFSSNKFVGTPVSSVLVPHSGETLKLDTYTFARNLNKSSAGPFPSTPSTTNNEGPAAASTSSNQPATSATPTEVDIAPHDRHLFLRNRILEASGKKGSSDGFFGHDAVIKVLKQQDAVKKGAFFQHKYESIAMEEKYVEACAAKPRNIIQHSIVMGIFFAVVFAAALLFGVASFLSVLLVFSVLGALGWFVYHLSLPENADKKLAPWVEWALYLGCYTALYVFFPLLSPTSISCNNSYATCFIMVHITMVFDKHSWISSFFLTLWVYIAAITSNWLATGRHSQEYLIIFPIFLLGFAINLYGMEWRRRRYFRDKLAVVAMKEATQNELEVFRQLLQLLVPKSVVEIVLAKAENRRSPCVDSLGEVCLVGLDISVMASKDLKFTGGNNSDLSSKRGGGFLSAPSPAESTNSSNTSSGFTPVTGGFSAVSTPLERFRRLEALFVGIEEELALSGPKWSQVTAPIVERIYTLGDRIILAGPLREQPKPKLPAKSTAAVQQKRSDLVCVVKNDTEHKEDLLYTACTTLCNLVARLRNKFKDDDDVSLKAILHQGPCNAAIVGQGRPTFSLLGACLQVTESLLNAAPENYLGCTDKFVWLHTYGKPAKSDGINEDSPPKPIFDERDEVVTGSLYLPNKETGGLRPVAGLAVLWEGQEDYEESCSSSAPKSPKKSSTTEIILDDDLASIESSKAFGTKEAWKVKQIGLVAMQSFPREYSYQ